MNIITAWNEAKIGNFLVRVGTYYLQEYKKKSNDPTVDLYNAVDYAKFSGALSAEDWVISTQPTVMVGEYKVENISSTGFNVGCQSVTWETVEKILALRPKEPTAEVPSAW